MPEYNSDFYLGSDFSLKMEKNFSLQSGLNTAEILQEWLFLWELN